MTLNDILRQAQDGGAIANLAERNGLTPDKAEAAAVAMLPAFSGALADLKDDPDALGALVKEIARRGQDPTGGAPEAGAGAAARVFGSPEAVAKTVERVASVSGVAPAAVAAMLPEVASILLDGLGQAMAKQGHAAALGDLAAAAAAQGGLGAALGHSGDRHGVRGFLGSIFGGSHQPVTPEAAALAGGLAALGAMFVAGVQASNQAGIAAIAQTVGQPPPQV